MGTDTAHWRRWLVAPMIAGLVALVGCSDSNPMSVDDSADFNTQRLVDAGLLDEDEQIYLIENFGGAGDGSIVYQVALSGGTANLTEVLDLTGSDYQDDFDAHHLAATPDGSQVYLVGSGNGNSETNLGRFDVSDPVGTFTDLGSISGLPSEQTVLTAFSPAGVLYAANNNDHLYTIDIGSLTATDLGAIQKSGGGTLDVAGADLVFDAAGTMYLWSNPTNALWNVDYTAAPPVATRIGGFNANFTGMAIRDAGTGALLGSSNSDDRVYGIDKSNGNNVSSFAMELEGSDYDHIFGDMTVGRLSLGCTSTQGYWKTHTDIWDEDTGQDPDADFFGWGDSWIEVLETPVRGNPAYNLAHQWIAAHLNQLSGTFVPSDVQDALDTAEGWLSSYGPEDGFWEQNKQAVNELADLLASYNEGNEDVPSCDVALASTCPAVTSSSGDVTVLSGPLSDVRQGESPADEARAFAEFAGYDHGGFPLNIRPDNTADTDEQDDVSDGTPICSYYVHFDDGDTGDQDVANGSLTFDADVLGLIVAGTTRSDDIFYPANTLCDTDAALGNGGTTYPASATCGINGDARGLEILTSDPTASEGNQDPLEISGRTVSFSLEINNKHDSFRIILEGVEDGIVPSVP